MSSELSPYLTCTCDVQSKDEWSDHRPDCDGLQVHDRIMVERALNLIRQFTLEDDLPLIVWEVQPHHGHVKLDGHACLTRGGATPAETAETVRAYAKRFGVEAEVQTRDVDRQDSINAAAVILGVPVEVWGVIRAAGQPPA